MKGNSSALRKGRFSEPGRIYLITFVTYQRKAIFNDLYVGRLVVSSLQFVSENRSSLEATPTACSAISKAATLAFVVMPDHVHWLIQLKHGSLEQLVHSVKSYSSRSINKYLSRRGAVWQRGFHDHALRNEEGLRALARYVVMNPVRAGLVSRVREYSLWDAVWL